MARSIHKPWLKSWVLGILNSEGDSGDHISTININRKNRNNNIPRIVQVISCSVQARCILISDTEYCVHVFFGKEVTDTLLSDYSVDSLKYALVKLSNYHLSTVVQCACGIELDKLKQLKVTYPLALFCPKITYLGASDCEIINRPTPLNGSRAVLSIVRMYDYAKLLQKLGHEQFPREGCLPAWDGEFRSDITIKSATLDEKILEEPADQLRIIAAIGSLDYSHIANVLPALREDEHAQLMMSGKDQLPSSSDKHHHHRSNGKKNHHTIAAFKCYMDLRSRNVHLEGDGWEDTLREEEEDGGGGGDRDGDMYYLKEAYQQLPPETQVDSCIIGDAPPTATQGSQPMMLTDCDFPPSLSSDSENIYSQFCMIGETQYSITEENKHHDKDNSINSAIVPIRLVVEKEMRNQPLNDIAFTQTMTEVANSQAVTEVSDMVLRSHTRSGVAISQTKTEVAISQTVTEVATTQGSLFQSRMEVVADMNDDVNGHVDRLTAHLNLSGTDMERMECQSLTEESIGLSMPEVDTSHKYCNLDKDNRNSYEHINNRPLQDKDDNTNTAVHADSHNDISLNRLKQLDMKLQQAILEVSSAVKQSYNYLKPSDSIEKPKINNNVIVNNAPQITVIASIQEEQSKKDHEISDNLRVHNDPTELYRSQDVMTIDDRMDLQEWYANSQPNLDHTAYSGLVDISGLTNSITHNNCDYLQSSQQQSILLATNLADVHSSLPASKHSYYSEKDINSIDNQSLIGNEQQRQHENTSSGSSHNKGATKNNDYLLKRRIRKKFMDGYYEGTVVSRRGPYYRIHYDDGDLEDLDFRAVNLWLIPLQQETPYIDDDACTQPQIIDSYNGSSPPPPSSSSRTKRGSQHTINSSVIDIDEYGIDDDYAIRSPNRLRKKGFPPKLMNKSTNNNQSFSEGVGINGSSTSPLVLVNAEKHQQKLLQQDYHHHQLLDNVHIQTSKKEISGAQKRKTATQHHDDVPNTINYYKGPRNSVYLSQPLSKEFLDNYYSHRVSYAYNNSIKDRPFRLSEPPPIPQEFLEFNSCSTTTGLRYSLLSEEQIRIICRNSESDIQKCHLMADIERRRHQKSFLSYS